MPHSSLLRASLRTLGLIALCASLSTIHAADKEEGKGSKSKAADEKGFVSLFNGKDLAGWAGATDGYAIEDGVLYCKAGAGGTLYTEKEYANFVVRLDYKLTPGANNGLGLRTPKDEGQAAFTGMEIQLLDDSHEKYKDIKKYQFNGSLYGTVPSKHGYLKPAGEWNAMEVTCDHRHVIVKLNGEVIVDADIDKASENGTMDGQDHPGLKRETGNIALLGHGDRVDFKNIRVKSLD